MLLLFYYILIFTNAKHHTHTNTHTQTHTCTHAQTHTILLPKHTCSGLVMFWKKAPSPITGSTNSTDPLSLENEHGSMLAGYKSSTSNQIPSTAHTPALVKTTALDTENDEDAS